MTVRTDPVCLSKHWGGSAERETEDGQLVQGTPFAGWLSTREKKRSQLQKSVLARGDVAAQFAA